MANLKHDWEEIVVFGKPYMDGFLYWRTPVDHAFFRCRRCHSELNETAWKKSVKWHSVPWPRWLDRLTPREDR